MAGPEQEPQGWSEGASLYDDHFAVFTRPYAADALDLLGIGEGIHLIDVAAGTGAASVQAAERGATVLATDFAAGMVEVLAAKLAAGGHTACRAEQMDGQALRVDDDQFDAGISMFGLMFFPDTGAGLRELRRAVRPGGRIAVGTWDLQGFPLTALVRAAVDHVVPGLPEPPPPVWAPLGSVSGLVDAFEAAGLTHHEVHQVTHPWHFADPARFLHDAPAWSPPLRGLLSAVDDHTRLRLADAFAVAVGEAEAAPGGLSMTADIAVATVPD